MYVVTPLHYPWKKYFFKQYFSNFISANYIFLAENWIIHHLVYLGHLPQFKETVELSTLSHWFDWSVKTKVLNTELWIQWGIIQA